MPKVLPEYLELRRQQILAAAAACFARRGFHQTTMQNICDAAGLSPGAVYRYFPSKEAIIEGMTDYRQRQNDERFARAMAQGATLEMFEELIRGFFIDREAAELDESCAMIIELAAEAQRNERIRVSQSAINANVLAALAEIVRGSQARGEIEASLDPEAVARVMTALYQGFVIQRLVDPALDVQAYVQVMRALFGGQFWHGEPDGSRPAAMRLLLRH